ncbi:MAG: O-antigen ligase family protein [Candidatus Saccharibacteria bacterium]
MIKKINILGRVYIAILLVIFGGIVLQGSISVGFGTLWPQYELLIKSWKEILMLVAGLIALFLLHKNKQMQMLRDPIIFAIGAYGILHLVMMGYTFTGLSSSLAGLAIDLRYVLYFGLVYIAMRLYPNYRLAFIKVGIAGALAVLVFALLQVFLLPKDVLKYIGYNVNTISPYLTVDQNQNYIRINSTLRGPNPLGAYAGMVLVLITAAIVKLKNIKDKWPLILILSVGSIVALWASYSRSAWIAVAVAIAVVLALAGAKKLSPKVWAVSGLVTVILIGGFLMLGNTQFISNIFLHENPNGGSSVNSNEGHISSLQDGLKQMASQPLGDGVGSTGSASLQGNSPTIIENQYLFTAHEVGWFGLLLFVYIFTLVMLGLWKLRQNWLALGLFASGIGLAIIGLLLPVWVDDTVSIIWWGMAAVTMGIGKWEIGNKVKALDKVKKV